MCTIRIRRMLVNEVEGWKVVVLDKITGIVESPFYYYGWRKGVNKAEFMGFHTCVTRSQALKLIGIRYFTRQPSHRTPCLIKVKLIRPYVGEHYSCTQNINGETSYVAKAAIWDGKVYDIQAKKWIKAKNVEAQHEPRSDITG